MSNPEECTIGFGYTRITYRKLIGSLFRIICIDFNGERLNPDGEFGFEARHLIGPFWWVDLKSYSEHVKKFDGGTFDVFTPL